MTTKEVKDEAHETLAEEDFLSKIKHIATESVLRQFEMKYRNYILNIATPIAKFSFDDIWKEVTGKPYFQPITTVPKLVSRPTSPGKERTDPMSMKYLMPERFTKIIWKKSLKRIGPKVQDVFTISGIVEGVGKERPLYSTIRTKRLKYIFPDDAEKIIKKSKTSDEGYVEYLDGLELLVQGFWEIQIMPKSAAHQQKDVRIPVDGMHLVLERDKPIILPGFHIEAMDNARRAEYSQEPIAGNPESGRKLVAWVQENQYHVLRQATYWEYLEKKEAGDKATRDYVERLELGEVSM